MKTSNELIGIVNETCRGAAAQEALVRDKWTVFADSLRELRMQLIEHDAPVTSIGGTWAPGCIVFEVNAKEVRIGDLLVTPDSSATHVRQSYDDGTSGVHHVTYEAAQINICKLLGNALGGHEAWKC
jgi:hypothetical protein